MMTSPSSWPAAMAEPLFVAGAPILPGLRLGGGGEGDVFAVEGEPAIAIKLYREEVRAAREQKVAAMVGADLAGTTTTIAFPLAEVRDGTGAFRGFTMALMPHARSLHELTSPVSRRIMFPHAGVAFLVRTALNAARAVAAVHAADCVIGDINHSGFLITDDARVMLIDADSFQVRAGEELFTCAVGVPEYTAPELIGRPLASVERTPDHDAFALAVVLFQLLFLGRHPYAGVARGPRVSVDDAMRSHRFAYSEQRPVGLAPPPAALTLTDWPPQLAGLFEGAFAPPGAPRPRASEWVDALVATEEHLGPCEADGMHARPRPDRPCPFCRVEKDAGRPLFSAALSAPDGLRPFDPAGAKAALEDVDLPDAFAYAPPPPAPDAPPIPPVKRRMVPRAVKWLTAIFAIGAGSWLAYLAPQSFVMLLIVSYGAIAWLRVSPAEPARNELASIDRRIARTIAAIQDEADLDGLWLAKAEAEAAIAEREGLEAAQADAQRHFRAERAEAARQSALARTEIVESAPVSVQDASVLVDAGVRTAADVRRKPLDMLADDRAAALTAWANALAEDFVPPTQLTPAEEAELGRRKAAIAARAPYLEQRIEDAMEKLKSATASLQEAASKRDETLDNLIRHRAPLVAEIERYKEDAPPQPAPPPRTLKSETAARLAALARRTQTA